MDNTTTITFRSQSRSVSVKAPASGYRANPEINQKVSVSGGGTIYTTDFGGETQKLQVQLRRLTRTEYAALKEFILTTCRGSAFSFDLTDYQGTHQNLHYISGLEGAELHRGDLFTVTLQLQKSTDQSIRLEQNLITNPNLAIGTANIIDGWHLSNAFTTDSPDLTPPALRNIDISEDFGTRALEVVDTDPDSARLFFTEKFPIADYRYTISGRLNRTAGNRACYLYVVFFDADGGEIGLEGAESTGWGGGRGGTYYYPGYIGQGATNNVWNLFFVTFGPGSNTLVPPAAKSFEMGTFIYGGAVNTTCRFADFSVIITP